MRPKPPPPGRGGDRCSPCRCARNDACRRFRHCPGITRTNSPDGRRWGSGERRAFPTHRQRKPAKPLTDVDHCFTLRDPCVASLRSDRHQIGMTDRHHRNAQPGFALLQRGLSSDEFASPLASRTRDASVNRPGAHSPSNRQCPDHDCSRKTLSISTSRFQ